MKADVRKAVPYCLRHSGASMDMLDDRRPVEAVKLHDRWKADSSLPWFMKRGRIASPWWQLPPGRLLICGHLNGVIGKTFIAQRLP